MPNFSVQIFGVKNSQPTRAAERFFKERGVQIHYVDLTKKPMSPGELRRFTEKFGGLTGLLETEGKEYVDAGLQYLRLSDEALQLRIEATPKLLRLPLVRGNNRLAIGQDEAGWKAMLPEK